jgi:hypothetical protein
MTVAISKPRHSTTKNQDSTLPPEKKKKNPEIYEKKVAI